MAALSICFENNLWFVRILFNLKYVYAMYYCNCDFKPEPVCSHKLFERSKASLKSFKTYSVSAFKNGSCSKTGIFLFRYSLGKHFQSLLKFMSVYYPNSVKKRTLVRTLFSGDLFF
jgi:hypothetical protein